MKRIVVALFCVMACFFHGSAQNLTGFWKGTLTMVGGCFPVNYIELQLTVTGKYVRGDSYHYLDTDNFIKKSCSGTYDSATKIIVVQEQSVTDYKIPNSCVICIKKYEFKYTVNGDKETLEGGWTGSIQGTTTACQPGTITLSRIKESFFKEPDVRIIKVDTGKIKLDFYDNGEIDGDSITVLVNKQVVLSHQMLNVTPITMEVHIDPSTPMQEVEMVADNLGTIPPNTALLVITAGEKKI